MDRHVDEEPFDVILKSRGQSFGFSIIGGTDTPMNGKGVLIKSIVPGGMADVDGQLKEGDEILRLNGSSLGGLTHFEVLALFKRSSSKDLQLTISRRKSFISSGNPTVEDQTLSKPISFTPYNSRFDRESLFDLLDRQNKEIAHSNANQPIISEDTGDVRKVVINRLPGESTGLEVDIKRSLGSDGPIRGIFVSHVTPGSAADNTSPTDGKIKPGDEILSINGTHLRSVEHNEALQIISEMPLRVEMIIRSRNDNDGGDDVDDDVAINIGKKGEVTFARPTQQDDKRLVEGSREDSRSFIRSRLKNKPIKNHREQITDEFKFDLELPQEQKNENERNEAYGSATTDDDATDSAFYEHSRTSHTDGRDTPLSSYVLQSRQSSIKHENFELRKYAFKKRRQDELGIYVEPCIIGNHNYLKVVDMSPDGFLVKHKLVERGDLLVSYNGIPLKDAARSGFDSILRDRGVVLEDVCLEILRQRNHDSDNQEDDSLETEINGGKNVRRTYDKTRRDLLSTEDSRTPSPSKQTRPISRDSGMVDGGISPDGRWGWTPGTESEKDDASRTDSPRFGLYFFDERTGEPSDKEDVSLVNFGKLSPDNSTDRKATTSESVSSSPPPANRRHISTRRSRNQNKIRTPSSYLTENISTNFDLDDFTSKSEESPMSPRVKSNFNPIATQEKFKPIPMPRRRTLHKYDLDVRNDTTNPTPDHGHDTYLSIQSENIEPQPKLDYIPFLPVTSIDDEIRNEFNIKHRDVLPIKNQISSYDERKDLIPQLKIQEDNSEIVERLHPLNDIDPNDRRRLLNFVISLLKNSNRLAQLPNKRIDGEIFRVNITTGLGIKMNLTSVGGVVDEIEKDGALGRDGNIRVGDCVLALNSTLMATMSSSSELQNFVDSLTSSVRLIVCRDPTIIAGNLSSAEDFTTELAPRQQDQPKLSIKLDEREKDDKHLELEFVISNQPVDLGLGHVAEIIGVNTPYTTVIYSERREEFATLEDIECFFKNKTFPSQLHSIQAIDSNTPTMEKRGSSDSFENDILLDGTRCGFVSKVDSFKRKFKHPSKLSVAA